MNTPRKEFRKALFSAAFSLSALLLHVGGPNSPILDSCTLPMAASIVYYGYVMMTLKLYPYYRSVSRAFSL